MAEIPTELKELMRNYIAQVNQVKQVDRAYLYGSYAKGKANKWSDIDVAIVSPDFSQDLFEERVLLMKLALKLDDRIEPSPFRPEDFSIDNPLVNEISAFGIEISSK
ncbi:nucleotidyltransferase domain-containing protein [Desulfonatronovibrio magnus]|uniref:nucleotidyltransferase domain-containing protein n=1 Tax=Desulfonatronovibrio magnus TaxID=698827 RepID=UPI0005EBF312|nr:nucleotidyltransferase domain-containing protein [Desulfonatronovibrio magnus]